MNSYFKYFIIATFAISTNVVLADSAEINQLNQNLDYLDAEIDRENQEHIIDDYRADDLHSQVANIRSQEGMYDTNSLEEQANAIEQQLYPPR